jgi:hypothetical protein
VIASIRDAAKTVASVSGVGVRVVEGAVDYFISET